MKIKSRQSGFSLTEVLMAVGILTVGLMLVATMFPVGIYLTAKSSERITASVVADEAFAKIRFYGVNVGSVEPNDCKDFNDVAAESLNTDEFLYPSLDSDTDISQYSWSALCKLADVNDTDDLVLVTVFVSRKTNPGLKYEDSVGGSVVDWPMPIELDYSASQDSYEINITNSAEHKYVNPPVVVLDNESGQLYAVVKKDENGIVTIDRKIENDVSGKLWVVPPPKNGGRGAGVAVYQKIIKF